MSLFHRWFKKAEPKKLPDHVAFLSFDIEALPTRASADHFNRLVWGKTAKGEFGIRRLSSILREYGLKGNFIIELAACTIYGDDAVREVFDFLLSEGHEVHAHLHSEMLARRWGFPEMQVPATQMHDMDLCLSTAMLRHAVVKFEQMAGRPPVLYRSGSYKFNRNTVIAAQRLGIRALSNYGPAESRLAESRRQAKPSTEPFLWSEGITEIPVDISSPEKKRWGLFRSAHESTLAAKEVKTCNCVLHSWSLFKRNREGHYAEPDPKLERQFRRICEYFSQTARVMGYEEYLDQAHIERRLDISHASEVSAMEIPRSPQCVRCAAILSREVAATGVCPSCGSTDFGSCEQRQSPDRWREIADKHAAEAEKSHEGWRHLVLQWQALRCAGDDAAARAVTRRIVEQYARDPDVLPPLAALFRRDENWLGLALVLDRQAGQTPQPWKLRLEQRQAFLRADDPEAADAALRQAFDICENDPRLSRFLAATLGKQGDWRALATLLGRQAAQAPDAWRLYLEQSDAFSHAGDSTAADAALGKALDICERDPELSRQLHSVLRRDANWHGLALALGRQLRQDPADLRTWFAQVEAFARAGDSPAADQVMERAVQTCSGDAKLTRILSALTKREQNNPYLAPVLGRLETQFSHHTS